MNAKLSVYVLTYNCEKLLPQVLEPLGRLADDLLVVDSGSTDGTVDTAQSVGARVLTRKFDEFRAQRQYALDNCRFDWVLSLDSDEIPNEAFVSSIVRAKRSLLLESDGTVAFRVQRKWIVLGKEVHAFYPVRTPDYPERLFRKDVVNFKTSKSTMIHEAPGGFTSFERLDGGCIMHYCGQTHEELNDRLERYTLLSAKEMKSRGKRYSLLKQIFSPLANWFKFYIRKGGYKDGMVGWHLGVYAFNYTRLKYVKLKRIENGQ
jgi:glycosyltransferase involved in cell wall biosynthesis